MIAARSARTSMMISACYAAACFCARLFFAARYERHACMMFERAAPAAIIDYLRNTSN